jgi:hypothetical protein
MDYAVASAWKHFAGLMFFLLSYDIMCQWSKNLKERLLKLPPSLRFHLAQFFVKFVIPKLHILGHLKICQDLFSLLLILGAAQADMEGIERIWSSSGLMGASTREMGPGSRQDTLDDFWHYWNWNKVVGMGESSPAFSVYLSEQVCRICPSDPALESHERACTPNRRPPRIYPGPAGRNACLEEGCGRL